MLKACAVCGRIHRFNDICPVQLKTRREYFEKRQNDSNTKIKYERNSEADKFRNTSRWRKKRKQIKSRDLYMCRFCFLAEKKITTGNLSVHHIVPLNIDYGKRLDDNNLITLCRNHHEQAESGIISAKSLEELITKQLKIPPGMMNIEN